MTDAAKEGEVIDEGEDDREEAWLLWRKGGKRTGKHPVTVPHALQSPSVVWMDRNDLQRSQ